MNKSTGKRTLREKAEGAVAEGLSEIRRGYYSSTRPEEVASTITKLIRAVIAESRAGRAARRGK